MPLEAKLSFFQKRTYRKEGPIFHLTTTKRKEYGNIGTVFDLKILKGFGTFQHLCLVREMLYLRFLLFVWKSQ